MKKILTTSIVLMALLAQAEIMINEIMADNGGSYPNAAGEAMDWLELYNAGSADVNVSGWGFQDDPTKAWSKWKTLPEGAVVPAGGYLLVWGDNKDFNSYTGITNGEVHVNMGLSKKGEGLHLALTNGVGTVVKIDGCDFPKQAPDVSWGRTESDSDEFLYFTEPTPAAANGDAGRETLVFTIDFDSNGNACCIGDERLRRGDLRARGARADGLRVRGMVRVRRGGSVRLLDDAGAGRCADGALGGDCRAATGRAGTANGSGRS